jgi:hypothetical protein
VISIFRKNILFPTSRHSCPEDGSNVFALKLLISFGGPENPQYVLSFVVMSNEGRYVSHMTYARNMSTGHLQNLGVDKRIILK